MLFLAIIVLGFISWGQIALEFLPGFFPEARSMYIFLYADAQPRETEEKVTLPTEDALSDIQGLSDASRHNRSDFIQSFHRSTDMDGVYNDIVDEWSAFFQASDAKNTISINGPQTPHYVGGGWFGRHSRRAL